MPLTWRLLLQSKVPAPFLPGPPGLRTGFWAVRGPQREESALVRIPGAVSPAARH